MTQSRTSTGPRILAVLALLTIIVAACGTGTEEEPETGTEEEPETGTEEEPEEGRDGGTLTLGIFSDPASFDPFFIALANWPFSMTFYDTLARYDDEFTLHPRLATEWEIAEDNTALTFEIRNDVTFHSGKQLTADDVVANIERARDPELGQSMLRVATPIDAVEAIDEFTIHVDFGEPAPDLVMTDLLNTLPIIDLDADIEGGPAGTGPFTLVDWNPGVSLTAERYEDYWDAENVYLDGIEYRIFDDHDARRAAYDTGEIDFFFNVPPRVAGQMDGSEIHLGFPGAWLYGLIVNSVDPPFDNRLARQALWYALDREAIVETVFYGLAEPMILPWPEASPAYADVIDEYAYDPDRALELFEEAGVDVEEVTGQINVSTEQEEMVLLGEFIQAQLADIGLELDIVTLEHSVWVDRLLATEYTLTMAQNSGGVGHPRNVTAASVWRTVNNTTMRGGSAPSSYVEAIEATETAIGEDEMLEAAAQLREAVLEEAFVQPLNSWGFAHAVKPHVQGFAVTAFSEPLLGGVWLDQ